MNLTYHFLGYTPPNSPVHFRLSTFEEQGVSYVLEETVADRKPIAVAFIHSREQMAAYLTARFAELQVSSNWKDYVNALRLPTASTAPPCRIANATVAQFVSEAISICVNWNQKEGSRFTAALTERGSFQHGLWSCTAIPPSSLNHPRLVVVVDGEERVVFLWSQSQAAGLHVVFPGPLPEISAINLLGDDQSDSEPRVLSGPCARFAAMAIYMMTVRLEWQPTLLLTKAVV